MFTLRVSNYLCVEILEYKEIVTPYTSSVKFGRDKFMKLSMLQGEGIQWLFTENKTNCMPAYFDMQQYCINLLYEGCFFFNLRWAIKKRQIDII